MSPALWALARTDLRAVLRDSLLLPLLVVVPLLILLVRVAAPVIAGVAEQQFAVDVTPHFLWALSALFVAQIPFMLGGIVGLLVLDERDDGTLTALQVTPLGLGGYARYRLATATGLALLLLVAGAPASGLTDAGTLVRALPAVVPAVLLVPAGALFLLASADNKIEGMAVLKATSFVLVAPLAAWFIDRPWTVAFGLVPTYWPLRAVWAAAAGTPAWPFALVGTVYVAGLLAGLARWARRRLASGSR